MLGPLSSPTSTWLTSITTLTPTTISCTATPPPPTPGPHVLTGFWPRPPCAHTPFLTVVDVPHNPTNLTVGAHAPSFTDHLPVRLSFSDGSGRASGAQTIPTWLAESPAFFKALRESWVPRSTEGAFKALERYKKALFSAARAARKVKIEGGSVLLRLSQHLALLRLVVSAVQDGARISTVLALDPALSSLVFFREGRWVMSGLEEATRPGRLLPCLPGPD